MSGRISLSVQDWRLLRVAPPSSSAFERHIYVITEADEPTVCKIGIARHAWWRLSDLQSGNPRQLRLHAAWAVTPKDMAGIIEAAVHADLADCHTRGEWFSCSPDHAAAAVEYQLREWSKKDV